MQIEFTNIELLYCLLLIPLMGAAWNVVTDDGMILHWYWKLLSNIAEKNEFLSYIVKPFGYCSLCLVGQFSFWFYVLCFEYDPIKHFFFVCVSIAMISLINYITSWLTKN